MKKKDVFGNALPLKTSDLSSSYGKQDTTNKNCCCIFAVCIARQLQSNNHLNNSSDWPIHWVFQQWKKPSDWFGLSASPPRPTHSYAPEFCVYKQHRITGFLRGECGSAAKIRLQTEKWGTSQCLIPGSYYNKNNKISSIVKRTWQQNMILILTDCFSCECSLFLWPAFFTLTLMFTFLFLL